MNIPTLDVATLQFPVTMDVSANVAQLGRALTEFSPGTLVVAPEGAISGYSQSPDFPASCSAGEIDSAIEHVAALVAERGVHLVAGACVRLGAEWYNASIYFGPRGERMHYRKVNLASSERGNFASGNELPCFPIDVDGARVTLAVQMCREVRYPEQWQTLARRGAQIFAFVTNAVGDASFYPVWRSYLISRAAENQRFVVGANNAAADQKCPSIVISPSGRVLAEAAPGECSSRTVRVDLRECSDWILSEARRDVVSVVDRAVT
jgi:predicted amidohydrolase